MDTITNQSGTNKISQNKNDVEVNKQAESNTSSQNTSKSTGFFAKYENLFQKFTEEISQIFTKKLKNREHKICSKTVLEFIYQSVYCTLKMIFELAMMIASDIVAIANIIKNVMATLAFVKAQHMHQQN